MCVNKCVAARLNTHGFMTEQGHGRIAIEAYKKYKKSEINFYSGRSVSACRLIELFASTFMYVFCYVCTYLADNKLSPFSLNFNLKYVSTKFQYLIRASCSIFLCKVDE